MLLRVAVLTCALIASSAAESTSANFAALSPLVDALDDQLRPEGTAAGSCTVMVVYPSNETECEAGVT